MTKMHTAQTGKHEGELVKCNATRDCPLQNIEDHKFFDKKEDIKEYSNLMLEQKYIGNLSKAKKLRFIELSLIGSFKKLSISNVEEIVDLTDRASRSDYIDSIDNKHFNDNTHGSTFVDTRAKNVEEVLAEVIKQRGNFKGDDRLKLIEVGADPSAFMDSDSGVRYLMINLNGKQSIKDSKTLSDDTMLTVMAKDKTDELSSLSFVAKVDSVPETEIATVIIGPKSDEERNKILGTNTLWTLHPGVPTRGIRSNDMREQGLVDGSTLTVAEMRKMFGRDIYVNTIIE